VTCGENAGVAKCVGEAVRQHTITGRGEKQPIATIGIAVLGSVSNCQLFTNKRKSMVSISYISLSLGGKIVVNKVHLAVFATVSNSTTRTLLATCLSLAQPEPNISTCQDVEMWHWQMFVR